MYYVFIVVKDQKRARERAILSVMYRLQLLRGCMHRVQPVDNFSPTWGEQLAFAFTYGEAPTLRVVPKSG